MRVRISDRGIENWSLTSLQQRLVKIGGRLVKHARYYWLLGGRTSEPATGGAFLPIGRAEGSSKLLNMRGSLLLGCFFKAWGRRFESLLRSPRTLSGSYGLHRSRRCLPTDSDPHPTHNSQTIASERPAFRLRAYLLSVITGPTCRVLPWEVSHRSCRWKQSVGNSEREGRRGKSFRQPHIGKVGFGSYPDLQRHGTFAVTVF
jgi:hypothetical protein